MNIECSARRSIDFSMKQDGHAQAEKYGPGAWLDGGIYFPTHIFLIVLAKFWPGSGTWNGSLHLATTFIGKYCWTSQSDH
jgi:hypothetical protein